MKRPDILPVGITTIQTLGIEFNSDRNPHPDNKDDTALAVAILAYTHNLISHNEDDLMIAGVAYKNFPENKTDRTNRLVNQMLSPNKDWEYGCWVKAISEFIDDIERFQNHSLIITIIADEPDAWTTKSARATKRSHLPLAQRGPGRHSRENEKKHKRKEETTHTHMGYARTS